MPEPSFRAPPAYLHEPFVLALLNTLLTNIDKGRVRPLQVNRKTLPPLFDFSSENTEYYWSLIVDLADEDEYAIFSIQMARPRPGIEVYEKARLVLEPGGEALLRHWLQRPREASYAANWKRAVESNAQYFIAGGAALLAKPIQRQGQTAEQVVKGFVQAAKLPLEPITLRALSAKCFWADSKFLDAREDLVRRLLPNADMYLITRPLLIHVAMAATSRQVLFVENQDTFLQLVAAQSQSPLLNNMTLINSAGFRGASSRIRQRGATQFSHVQPYDEGQFLAFQRWWLNQGSKAIPCYFWGDLDYSGMAILAALGQNFTDIRAWQPGYRAMLSYHSKGLCHSGEASGKERQRDPGQSHCAYVNDVLLPLLRSTKMFVDQEVVGMGDLHTD
ncbi:MAG: hypothetical protein KBT88_08510 [Gammaproteobacteria bacterium]|nr:hypothetical protein [Gammaproteobacteria bacterium]MBQ0839816.1 hypothetical protein [Gammaproteobacteria bacterium]